MRVNEELAENQSHPAIHPDLKGEIESVSALTVDASALRQPYCPWA
jgi:hypothetical protein